MSPAPGAQTAPETKPCVRCRVPINAASDYCTLCGAVQREGQRRWVAWLASLAVVAVIAAIAVVGGLVLGGATAPGQPYRLYQSPGLTTLYPSGWRGGPVPAASGTSRVVFADPFNPSQQLTVTAARTISGTAVSRARRIRALARSLGGFRQEFVGHVFFPGLRPAWRLNYQAGGYAHAVYVFSVCTPSIAMTVDFRGLRQSDFKALVLHIPGSASARC